MDPRQTPFPGKRQGGLTNKEAIQRNKTSKESSASTPVPGPVRPKRTFGVPRSTNVTIDRPSHKPVPSKFSANPFKGGAAEKPDTKREAPKKAEAKKVSFLEEAEGKTVRTPVPSFSSLRPNRPPGTPYLSAENCGKCKPDKLSTAAYWLAQIKLAEAVRKHFVSAAFFRLAQECNAQPFYSLQEELKHYVKRHGAFCREIIWNELKVAYKITDDKASTDPQGCGEMCSVSEEPKDQESMSTLNEELNLDEAKDDEVEDENIMPIHNVVVELNEMFNEEKLESGVRKTTPSQM